MYVALSKHNHEMGFQCSASLNIDVKHPAAYQSQSLLVSALTLNSIWVRIMLFYES